MDDHLIRFHGPGTIAEIVHSGPFLRGVLDALVDGCQQATRLLVEGRSSAAGTPPSWLEQAAAFQVRQLRGAEIVLDTRPLGDALPPGLPLPPSPATAEALSRSGLDLFEDGLEHAVSGVAESDRYDRKLIETFEAFGRLLGDGIDSIELINGRTLRVDERAVRAVRDLRSRTPDDRKGSLVGTLREIHLDARRFVLGLDTGERVAGIVAASEALGADLGALLGQRVLVTGVLRYRPSGRVLRVEAERIDAAEDVGAAIRRLVEQGDVKRARALVREEIEAGRGQAVARWDKLLAPPEARIAEAGTGRDDVDESRTWLDEHGAAYAGSWVALRGAELVDSDRSFKALQLRLRASDASDVLVVKCEGASDTKTGS